MGIMKKLWLCKLDGKPIAEKNTLPQNLTDKHWESTRRKINLICNNKKERKECYRDIEEIFLD